MFGQGDILSNFGWGLDSSKPLLVWLKVMRSQVDSHNPNSSPKETDSEEAPD